MVDPLSYFSFQPVPHNWCNKVCGMYYTVCWMGHIKDTLLQIGKSNHISGGSRFPLSLSDWSFTICPTPYSRKYNVLSVSLNKKSLFPYLTPLGEDNLRQSDWYGVLLRPSASQSGTLKGMSQPRMSGLYTVPSAHCTSVTWCATHQK